MNLTNERLKSYWLCINDIKIANNIGRNISDKSIKLLEEMYDIACVFEQIEWERDMAIEQLKDLGYSLCEKPHWEFIENYRSKEEYKKEVFDQMSERAKLDFLYEMSAELCLLKGEGKDE